MGLDGLLVGAEGQHGQGGDRQGQGQQAAALGQRPAPVRASIPIVLDRALNTIATSTDAASTDAASSTTRPRPPPA